MKERIAKLIDALQKKREGLLDSYLMALESYDGTMKAIEAAGLIHDIDKHITNLHIELKTILALENSSTTGMLVWAK